MTGYMIEISTAEGRKHFSFQHDKGLAEHIAENARKVGDKAIVMTVTIEPQYEQLVYLEDSKLSLPPDAEIIGEYMPEDPDGGRSVYTVATVSKDGREYVFQYREKFWEGLFVEIEENGKLVKKLDYDEMPEWAVQRSEVKS